MSLREIPNVSSCEGKAELGYTLDYDVSCVNVVNLVREFGSWERYLSRSLGTEADIVLCPQLTVMLRRVVYGQWYTFNGYSLPALILDVSVFCLKRSVC